MATALSLLSLIAATSLISVWMKRPFELVLPAVIAGLMIAFWAAGYVVPLGWLRYMLWVVGVGAIVVLLTLPYSRLATAASPGLIAFAFTIAVVAYASRNLMLLSWDEFSHWGQVARFLAEKGRYPASGEILFDGYPFGTALLQVIIGGSNEANWIAVQSILKAAALLPLLAYVSLPRQLPVGLIVVAFAVSTQAFFFWMGGPGDILIDMPLALYAGAALIIYYREKEPVTGISLAAIIAMSLPLFKDIGLILAAFISVVIIADQFFVRINGFSSRFITLIISPLPAVGAFLVNKLRSLLMGPTEGFGFILNWSTIVEGVKAPGFGARFQQTVEYFIFSIFNWPIARPIYTVPTVALMIAAVALGGCLSNRRMWFRPIAFLSVTLLGLVAYLALLLLLYIFAFSEYEGTRLASFPRYVNTFIVMALVASPVFILDGASSRVTAILAAVPLTIVTALMLPAARHLPSEFRQTQSPSWQVRMEVEAALDGKPEMHNRERPYVLWNGTIGEQFYMSMYRLVPFRTNIGCFSVGSPRSDDDIWSCDISEAQFAADLQQYDYLLLGRVDDNFVERFDGLFHQAPSPGWYRIDHNDNATTLRAVN